MTTTALRGSFLPLSLTDADLFSCLPHLLCPTTAVTLRGAIIFATIAVVVGCGPLMQRAHEFLRRHRGKWLDSTFPENLAFGFAKLMLQVPDALADDEVALLAHVKDVNGVLINRNMQLELEVPTGPAPLTIAPDFKEQCTACGHMRSFTLIAEDGRCGSCHAMAPGTVDPEPSDIDAQTQSHWVECKTCKAHYAVVDAPALNVPPRCHYCRAATAAAKAARSLDAKATPSAAKSLPIITPRLRCTTCLNAYVYPRLCKDAGVNDCPLVDRSAWPSPATDTCMPGFTCPRCRYDKPLPTETVSVRMADLVEHSAANTAAVLGAVGLRMSGDTGILDLSSGVKGTALRSILVRSAASDRAAASDVCGERQGRLSWAGKPVANDSAVLAEAKQWIISGSAEKGTCALCFDDLPRASLRRACGRRGCAIEACTGCLESWYGTVKKGTLLTLATLDCPFCKRRPSPRVLTLFNAAALRLLARTSDLDPNWYHGWCIECNRAKPALERVCAQDPPTLRQFECETCQTDAPLVLPAGEGQPLVKQCPNEACGAYIQKTTGCDHITCICRQHWCWSCRELFDEDEIYSHIWRCGSDEWDSE